MISNTSIYACPKCGNPNTHVERRPDGFCYCPDCQHRWKIGERQPKPTVFDRITASPEVLAEKLVDKTIEFFYDDNHKPIPNHTYYVSLLLVSEITGGKIYFSTKEEAIAATVKKLKEVEK